MFAEARLAPRGTLVDPDGVPIPLTAMLAAALLFSLQPLAGKQLLPRFGGSAALWSACLAFYQLALLAGYALIWASRRWGTRIQARLALLIALLATLWLGIQALCFGAPLSAATPLLANERPPTNAAPFLDEAGSVLTLLATGIGAPFLVLAMTSPLLASWQAAHGKQPYRLYAFSNAGSLLGLLCYPLLIEPALGQRLQAWCWSGAFLVLVIVLIHTARSVPALLSHQSDRPRSTPSRWWWWITLAAGPAALLVAISDLLCRELTPLPLLWVAPLAVYLISWILPFASSTRQRPVVAGAMAVLAALTVTALFEYVLALPLQLAAGLLLLGSLAYLAHQQLAWRLPAPEDSASFYTAVAAGGALGGGATALLAPLLLSDRFELHLAIALVMASVIAAHPWRRTIVLSCWLCLFAWLGSLLLRDVQRRMARIAGQRGFHGVIHVAPIELELGSGALLAYRMIHDGTRHGMQLPYLPSQPTGYYTPTSGVGQALRLLRARGGTLQLAVVGLGVGTLASYVRQGDRCVFFELSPEVVTLARDPRFFSYLADCAGEIEIRVGDARRSLAAEPRHAARYDLLVLDAFSGGAVPAHLLTVEAAALYRERLAADGVLAVHLPGLMMLDLRPLALALAGELGLEAVSVLDGGHDDPLAFPSLWIIAHRDPQWLQRLQRSEPNLPPPFRWRDDHHSLLPLLRWPR
jgi:hypothetical protein